MMEITYHPDEIFGYFAEGDRVLTLEFEDRDRSVRVKITKDSAKKLLEQMNKELKTQKKQ